MPAARVLALAASDAARIVDRLIASDADAARWRSVATSCLRNEPPAGSLELLHASRAALRLLKKNRIPDQDGFGAETTHAIAEYRAARLAGESLWPEIDRCLADADLRISAAIRDTAEDALFQRAVAWQNRGVLAAGIDVLLRHQGPPNSRYRGKERLIARYLQRYCVKNESIGAVGPVGWATWREAGPAADVRPGPALIATRTVYFEGWCIEALCATLAAVDGMRPWIAPRRAPGVLLEGTTLRVPLLEALVSDGELPDFLAEPRELSAKDAALVRACDGEQAVGALASALDRDPADVEEALTTLEQGGVLVRTIEIPVNPHGTRLLQAVIDRIGAEGPRAKAQALLDELEQARTVVAAATDARMIDAAIGALEATFTAVTGGAATRAAGQTYAARTLVYEDCRRDVDVDLGPEILRELAAPLSIVLDSARWLTGEVARRYREAFQAVYEAEAAKAGGGEVSLHAFSRHAQPLLGDADASPVVEAAAALEARWRELLGPLDGASRRVVFQSADLVPRARALFEAPGPGWALARYVSPDVMIAAASAEAICRGEYDIVLGEVHLSNTIGRFALLEQHPEPEALVRARARDIPGPCVIPVTSKTWNVQRNGAALVLPTDVRFEYDRPNAGSAGTPTVAIGECVVEPRDGGLVVRTRDGRACFDVIEFFGHTLSNQSLTYPRIVPAAAHTPRITIDRVVIARESWRLPVSELAFTGAETPRDLFVEARRCASRLGLPRFVFARIPGEPKPYFVDFESPIYLRMFALLVIGAVASHGDACIVGLTEMLPDFDQLWLVDAAGERYTSELRMVALDAMLPASSSRTR